jgi:phytoene dehydrogenase-like protein
MAAKNWDKTFINALAETSNVKAACDLARISQAAVYKKRREDADFARRWFEALAEGYDNLEMDLLARLREGRLEDVDADGTKRKFDIGTAFRCLIAHRETVNREKNRKTLADEVVTIKSINAKIDALRAKEEHAAELEAKRKRAKRDDR